MDGLIWPVYFYFVAFFAAKIWHQIYHMQEIVWFIFIPRKPIYVLTRFRSEAFYVLRLSLFFGIMFLKFIILYLNVK